jgi:tetratricopeptide (TPR) repeat protein
MQTVTIATRDPSHAATALSESTGSGIGASRLMAVASQPASVLPTAATSAPNLPAVAVGPATAATPNTRSLGSIVAEANRLGASGLFDRARGVIHAAITRSPHDADVLSTAGMIELNAGRPVSAAAYFRDAIAQNARHVRSHFGLGEAMLDLGDHSAALDEYRACLRFGATGIVARESAQQVAFLTR